MITLKNLSNAHKVAKAIAFKDKNNLSLTSSFFKDNIKYRVFCSYYSLMRIVDDHIDNLPPYDQRSKNLIDEKLKYLDSWERIVKSSMKGKYPNKKLFDSTSCREAEAICNSFIDSYNTIPVDEHFWTDFFDAMRSDLVAKDFAKWSDFLSYSKGASIAPTTIYLTLISTKYNPNKNIYELSKNFDLHECGQKFGLFAYLGHIIRDLAKDIREASTRIGITNEDMADHGLNLDTLKSDVAKQHASPSTRNLVKDLLFRAKSYHSKGRSLIEGIEDYIESDCRFILELIITIYENIIRKIESVDFDPMSNRHYLSKIEKVKILKSVANQTGFPISF